MACDGVTERVNQIHRLKDTPAKLFVELEALPTDMLCALLPAVASTGLQGAQYEAIRHGIEAILARRHTADLVAATDRMVQTMQELDRSTNRIVQTMEKLDRSTNRLCKRFMSAKLEHLRRDAEPSLCVSRTPGATSTTYDC